MAPIGNDIARTLGGVEAKLELILEELKNHRVEKESIKLRLSKLEHESTQTKTVIGIISAVAGGVGAFITNNFSSIFKS